MWSSDHDVGWKEVADAGLLILGRGDDHCDAGTKKRACQPLVSYRYALRCDGVHE
jgi:hypothetical protein